MNVTVTVRVTRLGDPQRPDRPVPGLKPLRPLLDSLTGCDAAVLHDGHLDEASRPGVTFAKIDGEDRNPYVATSFAEIEAECRNPYVARWFALRDWLVDHPAVEWVFAVDGTDVEMLHEPWSHLEPGRLYIGSEPHTWSFPWFAGTNPSVGEEAAAYPDRLLLNPGVVGGCRQAVLAFCHDVIVASCAAPRDLTDMGAVNHVGYYDWWAQRITTGVPVHTVFRAWDRRHPTAWWRHK